MKEAYASEIEDEDPDRRGQEDSIYKGESNGNNKERKRQTGFLDEKDFMLEKTPSSTSTTSLGEKKDSIEKKDKVVHDREIDLFSKESPGKKSSDKDPVAVLQKKDSGYIKGNPTMDDLIIHLKSNKAIRKGSETNKAHSMNNAEQIKDLEILKKETTIPIAQTAELELPLEKYKEKQKSQTDYDFDINTIRKSKKNLKPRVVKRKMSEISPQREGVFFMDDLTENFLLDPYFGFKSPYYIDVVEHEDYLEFGKEKLKKPFVEKPLDAENHNINIYYPVNDGGGCKRLFRKTHNVASDFEPNTNQIRKEGCYIYEAFLPTEGFDIKVYTVGPNYAHAETRKAPVLDGVVQRTKEGKEVRYPVNLTYEEKLIAKKIVIAFGQNVCGFDLLRSKGKSYVCDVNGWSFVKGSNKYYADCAILLRDMILAKFAPNRINPLAPHPNLYNQKVTIMDDPHLFRPKVNEVGASKEELRSVVAIFRHGDRKPKQKMKMIVYCIVFLLFFRQPIQDFSSFSIPLPTIRKNLLSKVQRCWKYILFCLINLRNSSK